MDFCWMKNTNKLVISVILNVILLGLIVSLWLRPDDSTIIVDKLKTENKSLLYSVDSLSSVNDTLNKQNQMIMSEIIKVENELILNNTKINDLEDGKKQISTFVDTLGVDGVQRELTRYLNNRTK